MVKRLALSLLLASVSVAAADEGAPVRVTHVPLAVVEGGADLRVVVDVEQSFRAKTIELRWKKLPAGALTTTPFARETGNQFVAVVPAAAVAPPGLAYAIVSVGTDGAERAHFASAAHPHPVLVRLSPAEQRFAAALSRVRGKRSRLQVSGELVDFGARKPAGGSSRLADNYQRLEVDFTYRLLGDLVNSLRLGYGRMRGETLNGEETAAQSPSPGLDYGFGELRFNVGDSSAIDGRVLLGADDEGFTVGTRGALQLGRDDETFVAMGAEYVGGVGAAAFLTLSWDTVPHTRMSATIHATSFPDASRDPGLRLVYELEIPVDDLVFAGSIGYQARDEKVGGLSGGARVAVQF